MALSEEAQNRLADIVELQPTKNAVLQDRWEMQSGSEVHQYLENELSSYYYRDDNSLIRATEEAAELVDVEPGVEGGGEDGTLVVRVPVLEQQVVEVLPDPDGDTMSVVAVLQAVRESTGTDPEVEEVREALKTLRRKDAVSVTYRLVPTYALAVPRSALRVEPLAAKA